MAVGGSTPQIAEAGAATTGAGCHWRLRPAPPRPDLFLHFLPFDGEGAAWVAEGVTFYEGRYCGFRVGVLGLTMSLDDVRGYDGCWRLVKH